MLQKGEYRSKQQELSRRTVVDMVDIIISSSGLRACVAAARDRTPVPGRSRERDRARRR